MEDGMKKERERKRKHDARRSENYSQVDNLFIAHAAFKLWTISHVLNVTRTQ